VIALGEGAADIEQRRYLVGRLDAFGDRGESQRVGQLHDRRRQTGSTAVFGDVRDERAIDLQMSIGNCSRWENEENPVPKSSTAMLRPNDFSASRLRIVASRSRNNALSVISRIRFVGSNPVSSNERLTLSRIELSEISRRREIHAHQETGRGEALTLPSTGLTARLGQHEAVDVVDEANLFGEGDEGDGLEESPAWVLPPDERFESNDGAGVKV